MTDPTPAERAEPLINALDPHETDSRPLRDLLREGSVDADEANLDGLFGKYVRSVLARTITDAEKLTAPPLMTRQTVADRLADLSAPALNGLLKADNSTARVLNLLAGTVTATLGEKADTPALALGYRESPHDTPCLWLPVGEIGIITGAGGVGKSWLALEIALAAAAAHVRGDTYGRAMKGAKHLAVRSGPALMVSYEDARALTHARARAIINDRYNKRDDDFRRDALSQVRIGDHWPPIWTCDERGGASKPGEAWRALATVAAALEPSVIVIDPATCALAGAHVGAMAPVRAMLTALRRLAERHRCAIIIVAHSNKKGRAADGGVPTADAIAGSSAWWDAARLVVTLTQDNKGKRWLRAPKVTHGRSGLPEPVTKRDRCLEVRLDPVANGGTPHGLSTQTAESTPTPNHKAAAYRLIGDAT